MNNLLSSLAGDILDAVEPIFVWVTVGIVGALLIAGLITFFANKRAAGKLAGYAGICFLFYALAAGIFMLTLSILKYYGADGKYANTAIASFVFLPILITLVLILGFSVAAFILSKKGYGKLKTFGLVAGTVCGVALIVSLVFVAIYFGKNIDGDGYYTGYGKLNSGALYASAAILVVGAIVAAFLLDKKDDSTFDTRCIAFAGIAVALSFALSYVKLWEMPQGGSVTLASMLPIMLFSYVYGVKKGMIVGLIYGLLQAVQDPYIVHPAQFLLDYPIAFALTSFAGAFKNVKLFENRPQVKFALASVIGAVLRFVSHVLSGVFAFGAYALDAGQNNLLLYSLGYNSFVFVDIAIVIVVGVILFSSKAFIKELGRFTANASFCEQTEEKENEKQA